MPFVIFQNGEDCASCKVQGIGFQPKVTIIIWISKNRGGGEVFLQLLKCVGLSGSPCEHLVLRVVYLKTPRVF